MPEFLLVLMPLDPPWRALARCTVTRRASSVMRATRLCDIAGFTVVIDLHAMRSAQTPEVAAPGSATPTTNSCSAPKAHRVGCPA
jgi:hypothetical protein